MCVFFFDKHLSDLAELFYRAHTEGIENMYEEPQQLGDSFTQAVKEIMCKRREELKLQCKRVMERRFQVKQSLDYGLLEYHDIPIVFYFEKCRSDV